MVRILALRMSTSSPERSLRVDNGTGRYSDSLGSVGVLGTMVAGSPAHDPAALPAARPPASPPRGVGTLLSS